MSKLLAEVVRDLHLGRRLAEQKACDLWPEVVGEYVARNTKVRSIDRGKLFVWVKTAAWQNEISLGRAEIIRKLNKALGEHVVEDIMFVSER
ncbi:MAG: DUF721 domain-containing protein [Candidatus Latescibacteria bacterium]|nr:DUF721 domain-containing protein [Candidatus Latescibacterota bacterium]MCK5329759.1 DUF721 domain-containing protein [Candidatus Latescibacterota bacterium]MCK5380835.1 DUF721 domain-containing protein [Candidatus Latescibacterota bacterium]MCK5526128.1 DUF721 domain-containing protein [Candidatus Latescibacterota bacterium]